MSDKKETSLDWLFSYMFNPSHPYEIQLEILVEAKQMYQDEIEAAAIIAAAEKGTQNASETSQAFAIGYSQGYTRALQLIQLQIENQLKTETK